MGKAASHAANRPNGEDAKDPRAPPEGRDAKLRRLHVLGNVFLVEVAPGKREQRPGPWQEFADDRNGWGVEDVAPNRWHRIDGPLDAVPVVPDAGIPGPS